jgi:hypothetical protein
MMADTTPAEAPDGARLVALSTLAEQSEAIDTLIGLAQQQIRVFDQDLSQTGWSSATRTDRLAAFLRGVRGRRLDVIVHDTRYLQGACPSMLNLLRNYGHAVTIYQTGPEGKVATDSLVIVDGRHYLHRFHFEQPRAALGIDQPEQTRPLASRFDEIWATGEAGLSGTVLGL